MATNQNKTGDWQVLQLTNSGRDMLTQARAGAILNFTRIAIGDGAATGAQIDNLTQIKSRQLYLPIGKHEIVHNRQMRLQFRLNNSQVDKSFYFREIGLMARIGDGEEKLYSYTTCGSAARLFYDKTYPIQERIVNIDTITDNAANINVILDLSIQYATQKDIIDTVKPHRELSVLDHPDNSVVTSKIKDKNVTNPKLADNAVSTAKVQDLSITTPKLANKSVTAAKLSDDVTTRLNTEYVRKIGDTMTGALKINVPDSDYSKLFLANKSGNVMLESTADNVNHILSIAYKKDGATNNTAHVQVPKKNGLLAMDSEKVNRSGDTVNGTLKANQFYINGNTAYWQNNTADTTLIRNNYWGIWASREGLNFDWIAKGKNPYMQISKDGSVVVDNKRLLNVNDFTRGDKGDAHWCRLSNGWVIQTGYWYFPQNVKESVITLPLTVRNVFSVNCNDVGEGRMTVTGRPLSGSQIKLYCNGNGNIGAYWTAYCLM